MNQTNHFFNLGYGWLCKHCSAEDAERRQHNSNELPPAQSLPLARWTDSERDALSCPRCGVEERVARRVNN